LRSAIGGRPGRAILRRARSPGSSWLSEKFQAPPPGARSPSRWATRAAPASPRPRPSRWPETSLSRCRVASGRPRSEGRRTTGSMETKGLSGTVCRPVSPDSTRFADGDQGRGPGPCRRRGGARTSVTAQVQFSRCPRPARDAPAPAAWASDKIPGDPVKFFPADGTFGSRLLRRGCGSAEQALAAGLALGPGRPSGPRPASPCRSAGRWVKSKIALLDFPAPSVKWIESRWPPRRRGAHLSPRGPRAVRPG